jgi:hypothetical protein
MYFRQKFGCGATLLTPSLLLSFAAITDHLRVGEVPPGRGPQFSAAPVNIPIGFWSQAVQSAGGSGPSLFLSGQLAPHHSGQITKTIALFDTPGEERLELVYARSRTEWNPVLDSPTGPCFN